MTFKTFVECLPSSILRKRKGGKYTNNNNKGKICRSYKMAWIKRSEMSERQRLLGAFQLTWLLGGVWWGQGGDLWTRAQGAGARPTVWFQWGMECPGGSAFRNWLEGGQAPCLLGLEGQKEESVCYFDVWWVSSRFPIKRITQSDRFWNKGTSQSKQCLGILIW